MKPADVCLAVTVAVIWGLAFVASRIALDEFSPPLMTALRFCVAALPCLLVPRPRVSWPVLIAISFTLFLGQFLAQAYGIAHGVPVGLSSVIVQSQALFTIALAAILFRELPTPLQGVGIGIAVVGLLMICGTVGYDFSVGAFAVIAISPVSFAIGNVLLRRADGAPMFDLFAWLCLVAAIPLLARAAAHVADRSRLHPRDRRPLDLYRLLAMGPAAAGLPRRASGAVRAAGAVRGLGCVQHRVWRALRVAAAGRNDHRRRWNRRDAISEAAASDRKAAPSKGHLSAKPCRNRCC
jgi:drug/metabolite transporter (DMT)-like permease